MKFNFKQIHHKIEIYMVNKIKIKKTRSKLTKLCDLYHMNEITQIERKLENITKLNSKAT